MILVTGATGNLGSQVIHHLSKLISPKEFIVTSSSQKGVDALQERGYSARFANFNEPNTLNEAFKDVSKVLLISTMENNRFEQHKNVIDAALQNKVKQLYYTGTAIKDIESSGVKDLMNSHFQTEDYLMSSGLDYTILRNTMYAEALPQILSPHFINGYLSIPAGSGKIPFVLREELGEGIAKIVFEEGHKNKVYALTGSESYSVLNIVDSIVKIKNEEIIYLSISDEDYAHRLRDLGFPEFLVYLHQGTIVDVRNNQYEINDPILEKVLGRKTADLDTITKKIFN